LGYGYRYGYKRQIQIRICLRNTYSINIPYIWKCIQNTYENGKYFIWIVGWIASRKYKEGEITKPNGGGGVIK